jgi:hypothetical protein
MIDMRELCEIPEWSLGHAAGRGALDVPRFRVRLYAILKVT